MRLEALVIDPRTISFSMTDYVPLSRALGQGRGIRELSHPPRSRLERYSTYPLCQGERLVL